jgi:predicted O-methyltransferase YrrM
VLSLPKWFVAAVGVVSAGIVLCFFVFPSVLPFAACVLLLATIVVITVAYRRAMRAFENFQLETKARENAPLRQMQSCFWLFARLQLRRPLPPMGGWAIGPDFAAELISIVLAAKPRVIVEASSGVSTLLIAYCLEQLGSGSVTSLDHEQQFADQTKQELHSHGFNEGRINVVHAPLKTYTINGRTWKWYDTAALDHLPGPIDLLVVDGPPWYLQEQSRLPALPLLYSKLSADAIVVLDDAARPGEKSIVKAWLESYPEFTEQYLEHEKGTSILRRPALFARTT